MAVSFIFPHQDLVSFYALGFTDPTVISEDWGSVRELATHYVHLIMKEQRHGPYFLSGYSYGGLLAYEMASMLIEQNQSVDFVAMIDTFPWSSRSQTIASRLFTTQRVDTMLSNKSRFDKNTKFSVIVKSVHPANSQFDKQSFEMKCISFWGCCL